MSVNLNPGKYAALKEQADLLGAKCARRFGSVSARYRL